MLECKLLMAECKAYEAVNINDFSQQYQLVVKMANGLGLEMRGKAVANSEWRIYQQLIKNKDSNRNYIENTHLRKALTESNRTEGTQFINKMEKADLNKHDVLKLCKSLLNKVTNMKNETVKYIKLDGEKKEDKCCLIISKAGWTNLTSLDLRKTISYVGNNNISNVGCGHLSKAVWKNLTSLDLRKTISYVGNNNISNDGCGHLSKAVWKNLTSLDLRKTISYIGNNKIENS
jgi:uncharacterized membrane protein YheB (UPF0754 family)